MRVLVFNAGSSSLKASVLDVPELRTLARVELSLGADATAAPHRRQAARRALAQLEKDVPGGSLDAVGHRVVHGGTRFRHAVRIDAGVLKELLELGDFAPLHNVVAVETIRGAQAALPRVPQVAAFDTAFHAELPPQAYVYPVPYAWYQRWGVRRFGFHGLSVEWATARAAALLEQPVDQLALVVAHLGSGCSVTAVLEGRSVDTSMGLTPMEGLMMGTRSGSVDPGILLYVLRTGKLRDAEELDEQLTHHSGLVGISGGTGGMRELEAAAASGDERARLAIDIFVRRAAAGIAAAASALPRLHALVFTGGIGEHSATVRAAIVLRLAPLGLAPIATAEVRQDAVISRSPVAVLRVEAREDAVVARQVDHLLNG